MTDARRCQADGVRFRVAFGCLLLLALVLRLGFVAATNGYAPTHDDRRYARLACSLVEEGAYALTTPVTTPDGCGALPTGRAGPTAFRAPAYPFFLAGVLVARDVMPGGFWSDARVANALLGVAIVGLAGLLALRAWGRPEALATAAVAAVSPPLILVGGSLMSEPLFVALVLAAVMAGLYARSSPCPLPWAAGAGVLVGLATLTRPPGLVVLLPLGFALAGAARGRRPLLVGTLVLAAVLVIAPWSIRNAAAMDAFIPVSDELGSWLGGTYNQQSRNDPVHPASSQVRVRAFADLDGMPEVPRQSALVRRSLDYAADNPGYLPFVLLRNTGRTLNLEGAGWWRPQAESMSLPAWAGDTGAYGFWALAALALAGALTARARAAPRWLWLVPLLLFAAVIVAGSEIRYRGPVEPFVAMLAGLALCRAAERRRV